MFFPPPFSAFPQLRNLLQGIMKDIISKEAGIICIKEQDGMKNFEDKAQKFSREPSTTS